MSLFGDISSIARSEAAIAASASALPGILAELREVADELKRLADLLAAENVSGITITPGTPTSRPPKERVMANVNVKLVKKSAAPRGAKAVPGAKAAGTNFLFMDNEDDTCTVQGVDASGSPVDISAVATLAVTSGDPLTISVDSPVGMTFKMHGLKPSVAGTPVVISATATWTDGSIGPFKFDLPCDVTGTAATGIVIVPGAPVVR